MIKIPKNEGWSSTKYVRYDLFHVPPMNTIQNTFFRSNSSSNAIFDRELTCKVRKYSKFVNKPHRTTFLIQTRGHARFAHSPLVISLGDSRIRRGNSGYGEVLSLGWHYNIFGIAFKFCWKITVLNLLHLQGVPFWFCILWSTGMTIIMTFRPEKRYLYVHWHILFYVVLTWVTPHKLTHLCIWKKNGQNYFWKFFHAFLKKNLKIWSPNEDLWPSKKNLLTIPFFQTL